MRAFAKRFLTALISLCILLDLAAPVQSTAALNVYVNDTVRRANTYNYGLTISRSGKRLSRKKIGKRIKDYGTYGDTPGMPTAEYIEAMDFKWRDVTRSSKKWKRTGVSLTKKYSYKKLVKIMRKLSAYDGVYMYYIGRSTSGKPMYALDVDLTRCAEADKHTVLLTGQVHARETAGPTFILKEIADLLNAYIDGDKAAKKVLWNTRYVAVACVNPDGHDGIAYHVDDWTYDDDQLWKATSNGTDLNRNFPGLSWMQLKTGNKKTKYASTTPDKLYYWGDYAGSCSETKAMMKFYQFFIGVEHAEMLIDYHQQGRITYAGKGYVPDHNNELCESLRTACYDTQKDGDLGECYTYCYDDTDEDYGLICTGSTNTDYAWAVAIGAMFSTKYGFSVYTDTAGKEYPLIMIPDYDEAEVELTGMRVPEFRQLSWEIGYGKKYLGYSKDTRELLKDEYYNYNFDEMLYTYAAELNK